MNEIRKQIEKIKQYIDGFLGKQSVSERDKKALKLGAAAVALFFIFMILKSLLGGGDNSKQQITELKERLKTVKELRHEYEYAGKLLKETTASIKKEDEALISVVEKILVDNRIERKSFSIKDSNITSSNAEEIYNERSVQVDIKRVSLQKAIDVLYSIQNRESFLKVSNLKLKTKFDKNNLLDMSFRLSTFEFN